MTYYDRAKELEEEIIFNRRKLHRIPEVGFALDRTVSFVKDKLREYGYEADEVGKAGIVCCAGKGGKTILLRCDMDALPVSEESGLVYAADNGMCHACGHDIHTAMLLCAAKMIKERENKLKGTVKFMFQPAEENIAGARDMIEAGILENPHVDAAIGMHVRTGTEDSKSQCIYYRFGTMSLAGDAINIRVYGKTAHGATPNLGVDAINIAMHIGLALQELLAREIEPGKKAVLLIGKICGGTSNNSVAGNCEMEISMRCENKELRDFLMGRLKQITENVARAFGGEAEVIPVFHAAAVVNDTELTREVAEYTSKILPQNCVAEGPALSGGEDFSAISDLVPSTFLMLGAGTPQEGYPYCLHDPRIRFEEHAFFVGAAVLANSAEEWLKNHL